MKKELRVCDVELMIYTLEDIDDPFVQEVLHFWKIQNKKGVIYYVPIEGKGPKDIASFILLDKSTKDWNIRGTWTDPKYRHQGLSSFLLKTIITDFKYNSSVNCLWVNITPGAEELYLRNGFLIYGKRTDCDPQFPVGLFSNYFNEVKERQLIKEKFGNNFEWYEKKN